eukprot:CAMPEP_0172326754 /NCGR_PEP_ID=MMETSP1058-20130122/57488_1 /TAXON_ID=83371 /ORGANISM="Detonula confervacea, Strain CCMP 353" /LENGTH=179 /DNA_ID=CAMNT_0013043615 /DNA_START=31 /DNA_END=570 /DNA_ORIENTATION=+
MKLKLFASAALVLLSAVPGFAEETSATVAKPIESFHDVLVVDSEDISTVKKSLRGIAGSAVASAAAFKNKYGDIFNKGALEDSCGHHCKKDSDCYHGGYVSCGKCGKYEGAQYYHQCYKDEHPAPSPTPRTPSGGQCYKKCHKDKDCQKGGYNECDKCNTVHGTNHFHKCLSPDTKDEE